MSGHTELTASSYVNSLPPLIMCEEGKSSLSGQLGTSSLLKLRGCSNYLQATDLGLFFPFQSNPLRHLTIPLYCTRRETIVALVSSDHLPWCIDGLLFQGFFCSLQTKRQMKISKLLLGIKDKIRGTTSTSFYSWCVIFHHFCFSQQYQVSCFNSLQFNRWVN